MSVLELRTDGARVVASRLRAVVETLDDARRHVAAASDLAALTAESRSALALLAVLDDEIAATTGVVSLTADRADIADSTFTAMLDVWVGSATLALRASVNDRRGTSVAALLPVDGSVPPAALLLAVTADGAEAWFRALGDDELVELVSVAEPLLRTSAAASVVAAWKAGLDAGGLRDLYTRRAEHRAGITGADWDPSRGLDHNQRIVEAVYEYYGSLYRADTGRFWWAGMAALIGPSFYGGFQDLDAVGELFDVVADIAGSPLGAVLPPGVGDVGELAGDRLAAELAWYETRLLSMQREIFRDMAPAHEAYLDGGIEMIERLHADDATGFGTATVEAWRRIDEGWRTGDIDLVADGNATLLRREQEHVIRDDYDAMRARPIIGGTMTWAMTAVGAPSVPGARTFAEVFPATIDVSGVVATPDRLDVPLLGSIPLPHVGVEAGVDVETPLPAGNISVFADRWGLIEADTLPVYTDLAANHPDTILELLRIPIAERAEAFNLAERVDDLARHLLTSWGLDPELGLVIGW